MSSIIDFYNNKLNPSGYTHSQIIEWSDYTWDECHDFIQWVFPLKEKSEYNEESPILKDEDITKLTYGFTSRYRLSLSYFRFLEFLGFCDISVVGFGDEQPIEIVNDNSLDKQWLWNSPNHNWLRITRVLKSLRLLGMDRESAALFACLRGLYEDGISEERNKITQETFKYWADTQV